jgi:hypothetical protein
MSSAQSGCLATSSLCFLSKEERPRPTAFRTRSAAPSRLLGGA